MLNGAIDQSGPLAAAVLSMHEEVTDLPTHRSRRRRAGSGRTRHIGLLCGTDAAVLAATGGLAGLHGLPLMVAVVVLGLAVLGLYRPRLTLSILDDLPRLLAAVLGGGTATALCYVLAHDAERAAGALTGALLLLAPVIAGRRIGYAVLRRARRRRPEPALIIGAGRTGYLLGRALVDHPSYGTRPVGYLDIDRPDGVDLLAPYLGQPRDVIGLAGTLGVENLFVASASLPQADLADLLRACRGLRCQTYCVPAPYPPQRGADRVRDIPLVRVRPAAQRMVTYRLRRPMDILLAGTALLLLGPIMALCALAVRLETGPGVLFRQERVGLRGRTFHILKFRSLRPVNDVESQTKWTVAGDPRLGPVGRLLRSTSLDELPQLINVLRGEMTLVGPRPERPYFVERFGTLYPHYLDRHRVPAGITGWAQIHGLRGDTSIDERARFDNYYIDNWSLWTDVKILMHTAGSLLRRLGG